MIGIVDPEPPPPLPGLVPAWLDRLAQFGWRTLIVIGLIALLVTIVVNVPLVVLPVLIALILTATVEPSVTWLVARGRSRGRAAAIALGGGTLIVFAALALAVVALVHQVPELTSTVTTGATTADASADGLLGLPSDAIASGAAQMAQTILGMADQLAALVTVTVLGILLAFYFLRDGGRLWGSVAGHLQPETEPEMRAAGSRAFDVLGGYMIGTGAISFVGAASQWVIMVVLGLPLAFPVFVLSFFLGYIPYIGGFISTGIAFLIAVAVGDPDRRADHGDLDDRLQPRGRQHRQPAGLRKDRPHPPSHRARGHPRRIGHRWTHRHVRRGTGHRHRGCHVADGGVADVPGTGPRRARSGAAGHAR